MGVFSDSIQAVGDFSMAGVRHHAARMAGSSKRRAARERARLIMAQAAREAVVVGRRGARVRSQQAAGFGASGASGGSSVAVTNETTSLITEQQENLVAEARLQAAGIITAAKRETRFARKMADIGLSEAGIKFAADVAAIAESSPTKTTQQDPALSPGPSQASIPGGTLTTGGGPHSSLAPRQQRRGSILYGPLLPGGGP